jgi:hypothetical protein
MSIHDREQARSVATRGDISHSEHMRLWWRRSWLWLANGLALGAALLLAHHLLIVRRPLPPLRLPSNRPVVIGDTVEGLQAITLRSGAIAVWRVQLSPGHEQIQIARTSNGMFGASQALSTIGAVSDPQLVRSGPDSALVVWRDPQLETVTITTTIGQRQTLGAVVGPQPVLALSAGNHASLVWANGAGLNVVPVTIGGFGRRTLLGPLQPGSAWSAALNSHGSLSAVWDDQRLMLATRQQATGIIYRQVVTLPTPLTYPQLLPTKHLQLSVTNSAGQLSLTEENALIQLVRPRPVGIEREPAQPLLTTNTSVGLRLSWLSPDQQLQSALLQTPKQMSLISQAPAQSPQALVWHNQLFYSWRDIATSEVMIASCSLHGRCQRPRIIARPPLIDHRNGQLSAPALVANSAEVEVLWFAPEQLGRSLVVGLHQQAISNPAANH